MLVLVLATSKDYKRVGDDQWPTGSDEKTQIHPLERTQPLLPLAAGAVRDRIAALSSAKGEQSAMAGSAALPLHRGQRPWWRRRVVGLGIDAPAAREDEIEPAGGRLLVVDG